MIEIEIEKDNYKISTNKSRLDIGIIQKWLNEKTYWARNRTAKTIENSINNSLCFGLFTNTDQIGFARVVTDYATFAWLCDVFIDDEFRGKGLGKWLIETITNQELLKELGIFILATKDAHGLYEKYGDFHKLEKPDIWMTRPIPSNQ